jgi:hypothetical protein
METVKYLSSLTLIRGKCNVALKMAEELKGMTLMMGFYIKGSSKMTSFKETGIFRRRVDPAKNTNTKETSRMEHQTLHSFQTSLEFRFRQTRNRTKIKKRLINY